MPDVGYESGGFKCNKPIHYLIHYGDFLDIFEFFKYLINSPASISPNAAYFV